MNLTFTLRHSPDFIFDYLTDMNKFASVHPLITKIENRGGGSFLVHETLKLAFFPYSFTYPGTIESNRANKTVTIKATVMKLTRIEMHFTIRQEGDLTIVDETISFRSILPVKSLMENVFREQHEQLFKNINSLSVLE